MKKRKTTRQTEKWAKVMAVHRIRNINGPKYLQVLIIRDMKTETTLGYNFSWVRLEKFQKFDQTLCWLGAREADAAVLSQWNR